MSVVAGGVVVGPVPITICCGQFDAVPTTGWEHEFEFEMPCDGIIVRTSAHRSVGSADVDYSIVNDTIPSGTIVGRRNLPGTVEVLTPNTSPALNNRVISQGDRVEVTFYGDPDTGVLITGTVMITILPTGGIDVNG